jgi:hypothetical protein
MPFPFAALLKAAGSCSDGGPDLSALVVLPPAVAVSGGLQSTIETSLLLPPVAATAQGGGGASFDHELLRPDDGDDNDDGHGEAAATAFATALPLLSTWARVAVAHCIEPVRDS